MSIDSRSSNQEGHRSEEKNPLELSRIQSAGEESSPWGWRWLIIAIVILSLSLALIVGAGMLGYLDGLKDRQENLRTRSLEHYRNGVAYLEVGEYDLALAELEEALRLQPGLSPAWEKLREAQMRVSAIPTPTSIPIPPPQPTVPPSPETESNTSLLLEEAQALHAGGDYLAALEKAEALLQLEPELDLVTVRDILFDGYSGKAAVLLQEERLEEAIRFLDLALQLRPDDRASLREHQLVTRYVEATGYWGVDWQATVSGFTELYRLDPGYRDVANRLFQALVVYGESFETAREWCAAQDTYDQALRLSSDTELVAKRDRVAGYCLQGTVPVEGENQGGEEEATVVATGEDSPAATRSLGLVGTIYYSIYDNARREYVLYRIDADGSGQAQVVTGMHQPQVNLKGTHLIARARSGVDTLGLYLIDLNSGTPPAVKLITSHVDDLYPSFSPDGQQIAFTTNRMSQRLWTVFTTWIDGESELTAVTQGHTPAWSPAGGDIAYKGCDERGDNCGIYVVSQDGQERRRVVTDPSAGFPAWSPDGRQIAFLSSRDGNSEVYLVKADGSGLRRLTRNPSSDGLPAWSPDGKAVAYMSHRDGEWAIHLHRLEDNQVAKLVTLETTYRDWLIEQISWGPAR